MDSGRCPHYQALVPMGRGLENSAALQGRWGGDRESERTAMTITVEIQIPKRTQLATVHKSQQLGVWASTSHQPDDLSSNPVCATS